MERRGLSGWTKTAIVISAIGAINWGLVGVFEWNLLGALFGGNVGEFPSGFTRFLYIVVGVAGIISFFALASSPEESRKRGPARLSSTRREVHP